jgi:hypothetical protein
MAREPPTDASTLQDAEPGDELKIQQSLAESLACRTVSSGFTSSVDDSKSTGD